MIANTSSLFLKVKDHSVSQETFELHFSLDSDMLLTKPRPTDQDLGRYYESVNYISHTDGKRTIIEKMYQWVKSYSLKSKITLINQLQKEKGSLLDIGAGTGDFLNAARQNGWEITGVEPNGKASDLAKQKSIKLFTSVDALDKESFDIITLWHVLEHIPDLEIQIKNLKKLLKPDGHLIIAVPNFRSYDATYYKEFWAAYDVPRHLWHFSKSAISRLFLTENMLVEYVIPMKFDSFYVSMLSEKYKTGSNNYLKAALIGLKSNWNGRKSGEYSSHIYIIKNRKVALK